MTQEAPFPPGSQVCGYFRDSGGSRQELSTEQQEQVFRKWCAEHGYLPGRTFTDAAKSGKSTVGREQFNELIKYFDNSPKEAGVVFFDYSRFARDFDDSSYFLAGLRRKGYVAYSIENYVPSGSTGKVVEALYLWSAEEYRRQLSVNVKRGRNHMIISRHAWMEPHPPKGYKIEPIEGGQHRDGSPRVNHRLVIDPATALTVRQAFEMAAAGSSLPEIMRATRLYGELRSIKDMLANPIYLGIYARSGLRVEGFCDPLIDRELWEQVQEMRSSRRAFHHPRSVSSTYLLSGLVTCARCGHKMISHLSGPKPYAYRYYKCVHNQRYILDADCPGGGIVADDLEADVLAKLEEVLSNPTVLEASFAAYQVQDRSDAGELIEAKRRQLADINAQLGRITDAIARRPDSLSLLDKLDALEKERFEAMEALAALEAQPRPVTLESLEELRVQLLDKLRNGTFRQKQLLLRALNTQVRVMRTQRWKWKNPYTGVVEWDFGVQVSLQLGLYD